MGTPSDSTMRPAGRVAVLGAGSWGSALAMQLARNATDCVLWARSREQVDAMRSSATNERFLPGIRFPSGVEFTDDLGAAVTASDQVLLAIPSDAFDALLAQIRPFLENRGLSWACKGLQPGTGRFLHQAAQDLLGESRPLAVVTGPSFAVEVARGQPTAVTVAGTDPEHVQVVAGALHGGYFRAYMSDDIVGAELGGAVKNVLAVATGISDGMGLGDNARAALVTRGMAEMMRLGRAIGAREQTLIGLAGMGDLVLTCTGDLSRNRRLGLALGKGQSVAEAVAAIGQVVEGVNTSSEVWRMACQYGIDMPISEQVHDILHSGRNPEESLRELFAREQKQETI
ncbi:NAD(P)H-dependent glycerol-3-phosphate dehydrogenase [Elongatibacter sediminis]|uniref:Glycerol-3-phosphate dehydrogenase [NAD(P)+] n=1 Tax=Elongatibacter sediminis TaxID=3119006 RepID=A0AAW9RCV9_9GAMM